MNEKEIWKDIPEYEGLYQVNQWGDIYSLISNKRLKYSVSNDGYKQYNLRKNKKPHIMLAHRAVALAFIPNPNNYPIVNHKDENPLNCYVDNLEWCTVKYNNIYSDNGKRSGKKTSKSIYCYNLDGTLFKKFDSIRQASRFFNVNSGNICNSAKWLEKIHGKKLTVTVKGKIFSYIERSKDEIQKRANSSITYCRKNNFKSKKVAQLSLKEEIIQIFPSTCEVERQLKIPSSQISRASRGYEQGYTSHGYKWKYID
jgi:hypothetical protein